MSDIREIFDSLMTASRDQDLDAVEAGMTSDSIHQITGRSKISGVYHGFEGHEKLSRLIKEETGGTAQYDFEVFMYGDNVVASLARMFGARKDKEFNMDVVFYWRFKKDLLIEATMVPIDPYKFDDFFTE